jgi:hypothetical protein
MTRLDDIVRLTGIPKMSRKLPRQRRLRWLPFLPFLLGTIDLVWLFANSDPSYLGFAVQPLTFALCIAVFLAVLGPLRKGADLDEREVSLHRDAYLFSLFIIGALQTVGIGFFMAFAILKDWTPGLILMRLGAALVYFWLLFMVLPTWYASWVLPEPTDEHE